MIVELEELAIVNKIKLQQVLTNGVQKMCHVVRDRTYFTAFYWLKMNENKVIKKVFAENVFSAAGPLEDFLNTTKKIKTISNKQTPYIYFSNK